MELFLFVGFLLVTRRTILALTGRLITGV